MGEFDNLSTLKPNGKQIVEAGNRAVAEQDAAYCLDALRKFALHIVKFLEEAHHLPPVTREEAAKDVLQFRIKRLVDSAIIDEGQFFYLDNEFRRLGNRGTHAEEFGGYFSSPQARIDADRIIGHARRLRDWLYRMYVDQELVHRAPTEQVAERTLASNFSIQNGQARTEPPKPQAAINQTDRSAYVSLGHAYTSVEPPKQKEVSIRVEARARPIFKKEMRRNARRQLTLVIGLVLVGGGIWLAFETVKHNDGRRAIRYSAQCPGTREKLMLGDQLELVRKGCVVDFAIRLGSISVWDQKMSRLVNITPTTKGHIPFEPFKWKADRTRLETPGAAFIEVSYCPPGTHWDNSLFWSGCYASSN